MKARRLSDRVEWLGAVDWERRVFDALIPLPDGTTYNAYRVRGSEATALIDTVDPPMASVLLDQLAGGPPIDYVVSLHAEPDHSGALPEVLDTYPDAKVVCSHKGKTLLTDLYGIAAERFLVVADGETLSLGDRTLRFVHTPWVHWPETMVAHLEEERILFTCDLFGAHIASSDLLVTDEARMLEAAKRYFAEIMLPFRSRIRRNLAKLDELNVATVAPSHGPIHDSPDRIVDAYRQWASEDVRNRVVLPYVSMHGSTRQMVEHLTAALVERGVVVECFDLAVTDIGKLATALVDAATIVVGTPTVLGGPHPLAAYAAVLANALRPKARFLSVVGSFGWGGKAVEALAGMLPNVKAEVIDPLLVKGRPRPETLLQLDALADAIATKHAQAGLMEQAPA